MNDKSSERIKRIRKMFLRGVFSILPLAVTAYVILFFLKILEDSIGKFINEMIGLAIRNPEFKIPAIGLIVSILLVFLSGFIVTNFIGANFFAKVEKMLHRIPVVPKIYFGIKQIVEAFSLQGSQLFSKVALVEYPRKGLYAIGFVTGNAKGEIQLKTEKTLINVFIPTTPNPTSGMLLLVPEEDVEYLDMSVEDGLKLIISAGVVVPDIKKKEEQIFESDQEDL
jgi:uncharacterized membrane protein